MLAAVEGYAVAGGLELAVWCDLRVAARDAVFGVFCRRWGVPLIDGGTVRLPRLIGHSHALDLILTGRGVSGDEALRMGLANRLTEPGGALPAAVALAHELAALPQTCMRMDRRSSYEQWDLTFDDAIGHELALGRESRCARPTRPSDRFVAGEGRHGARPRPDGITPHSAELAPTSPGKETSMPSADTGKSRTVGDIMSTPVVVAAPDDKVAEAASRCASSASARSSWSTTPARSASSPSATSCASPPRARTPAR